MIFFYSLCGVGVVAAGLAISELFGRRPRRAGLDRKRINAHKAEDMVATFFGGEHLPPPDDGRPPR
jgi:hypothetical protein